MTQMWTFGHGTAGQDEIERLLHAADTQLVVDVRSAPGSRRNPHVARSALGDWLPRAGMRYRWEPRLGGFRRVPPDSPDIGWRNDAFRAYAVHMRTREFLDAADELLADVDTSHTAVMCSESVWWRCHRRLIADFVALVHTRTVTHLMHDGRHVDHPPTPEARLRADDLLVYDRAPR